MSVQPPPPPPKYAYPPVIIILTIVLLICFFIFFFSLYFCRCFMHNLLYLWHVRHSPNDAHVVGPTSSSAPPGLDKSIVQSFPTFTYSSVKNYRKEKYGLECAICLVEFEDKDDLRLLTTCCHVFHQECIDLWLEMHKTCPVCRGSLDSPMKSTIYSNSIMQDINENEPIEDSVSITIKDEHEDETRGTSANGGQSDHSQIKIEKFPRSNSTGHSIVMNKKELEDRYTLRLPEHIKSSIIKGHNPSKSWSTFGEYKNRNDNRHIVLAEILGLPSGENNKP